MKLRPLDLDTLVCTRGPNFPPSRLESRLMCPAGGSHRVGHCGAVAFSRTSDPALGDFEDAVILSTMGEVDIGLLSA